MIEFDNVTITYTDATQPAIHDVNLLIEEGELALLVGRTGCGKSTLLKAINGLVPHFTGGMLDGRVVVDGRDTRTHPPRELADVVGFVPQDPMNAFVTDTVEEELAYGMEALGIDPQTMRRRVEDILDLLGLAEIRDRPLRSLSGGQRQRTAIGAVLTPNPAVLILDEPTSALDPGAAEEVLAAIQRLVLDLGLTVLMAEHRLERVVQYADRVVVITDNGAVSHGDPTTLLATAPVSPPVVELGRRLGISPVPLSVRDARRDTAPARRAARRELDISVDAGSGGLAVAALEHTELGEAVCISDSMSVQYGRFVAVSDLSTTIHRGEIVALMGRNGAGKSTFLNTLVGINTPSAGSIRIGADLANPAGMPGKQLLTRVGLVPQEASDLLYSQSVADECASADRDSSAVPGTARALLERFAPGIDDETHPRDLSEGQRLCLVLAVVLTARPALILLDEPTRGLDYPGKQNFTAVLRELAAQGHAILMATHDVELVAATATRVLIIADGDLVADGPTEEVVVSSPMFAPQVSKVMRPIPVLTVDDAVQILDQASATVTP